MADCPSCLAQAQGMLEPPQVDDASQWLLAFGDVRPSVFLKIEVPPEPRCAAQPRAPPQR